VLIPRRLRPQRQRRPKYVIETDQPITLEQADLIRRQFNAGMRDPRRLALVISGGRVKELRP
jgi:hypothetical protein